ncbi:hypothetical protein HC891_10725 [Candidatus Gracilibacteria bacterium]|nr:hypothetical protein [Candidatus Gracilibacteria bacterium]
MTETPKKSQEGREAAPKNPARTGGAASAAVTAERRRSKRRLAEDQRQRRVWALLGGTLGAVILVLLAGLIYDQVWVPSRPVASVGSTTLNTRDYRQEQRHAFARQVAQNFQLLGLFAGNAQISGQFAGQSPGINQQVRAIGDAPVNEETVNQWIERELKTQGANAEGITVTQDEINQELVGDLGQIFLPPPVIAPTATTTLTPTTEATLEPTLAATAAVIPTAELTPTPEVTTTPEATATLQPTPGPTEAADQVGQIIDELFRRYEIELAPSRADPELSKDDFRNALSAQYREQAITRKVQEKLVPDAGFTPSTEPERVSARQVLIAVALSEGASQEESDASFNEALLQAQAVAEELRGGADFAAVAAAESDDAARRTMVVS